MSQEKEFQIDSYRLFLDISSTCTGYCVAKITQGRSTSLSDATCEIVRAGAIWFPDDWTNEKKNYYMYRLVSDDFYVIYERYSFSMKQRGGSLVVPEMIGAIKVAAFDTGSLPMGVEDIPPNVWRSQLGLKAVITEKKVMEGGVPKVKKSRDYKTPCIDYMNDMFKDKIPAQLISNVTGKLRNTPNDVFDALGVCLGWHTKFGVKKFKINEGAFNTDVISIDV